MEENKELFDAEAEQEQPAESAELAECVAPDAVQSDGAEQEQPAESTELEECVAPDAEQSDEPDAEADTKKQKKMNMAYAYAITMSVLFALSFVALTFVLLLGYKNGYFIFGDGKYVEKVIYVREYDSESGYLTFPEIYHKVSPSVVSIESTVPGGTSIGTGFVMDKDGHIATNYHVIEDATSVKIIFINGITVKASIVGGDELADLAVLKIEPRDDLVPVEFGDSAALVVGEDVCAIGNPANIEYAGSMTRGIVSGLNRSVKIYEDSGMLAKTITYVQTDTTLNRGNSGGPLIDMYGKVIGVNTMKLAGDYEGISFAIPINGALEVLTAIIEGRETTGGGVAEKGVQLGITCGSVVKGQRYTLDDGASKIAAATGVIVSGEAKEGFCSHGILLLEDIIVSVDGVVVTDAAELRTELYKHKVGESAVFTVCRNGRMLDLTITF